jgi:hypothetical protein
LLALQRLQFGAPRLGVDREERDIGSPDPFDLGPRDTKVGFNLSAEQPKALLLVCLCIGLVESGRRRSRSF